MMMFKSGFALGLVAVLVVALVACTRRGPTTSSSAAGTTPVAAPESQAGTTVDGTLPIGGRTRSYHVHYPATAPDGPAPLVIGLHGGMGSGPQFEANTGFDAVADENGFVIVYPDGIGGVMGNQNLRTWNAGNCCGPAQQQNIDDVAFIDALIDQVSTSVSIDPDRVYAVGHSNGGIMAYRLACELSDKIAAIGVYAASLGVAPCQPAEPVSVMHVHGTGDQNIPINGGAGSRSLAGVDFAPPLDGVRTLAGADGCADPPTVERSGDLTTTTWSSCEHAAEVRFVTIDGASHAWPGGTGPSSRLVGPAYPNYDTSAELWAFLAAHPRTGGS